jgi:hypothetical protein
MTEWLMRALIVVGLWSALWVAVSGPAFVAKGALRAAGLSDFPKRAAALAVRFGTVGNAITLFFERFRQSVGADHDHKAVRVVIRDTHKQLHTALAGVQRSMNAAVDDVKGLSGVSGPNSLLDTVKALEGRTKLIDSIAIDIDADIGQSYENYSRARTTFVFISFFSILFALANGTLLDLFFKGLIAVRIVNVPASLLLSMMIVVAEMALGFLLALMSSRPNSKPVRWLLVGMIVFASIFEAAVLGMVSNNFDLDLPLLENYPGLKLWMGILGPVLVTATSITGFMFHKTLDEMAEYGGALRLKREIAQANLFVSDLPGLWDRITRKAVEAENALKGYFDRLSGQGDHVTGAIERITKERDALSAALQDARTFDWLDLADGAPGDNKRVAAQNVGLCLVSFCAVLAYVLALAMLFGGAIGHRLPPLAPIALSIVIALAFYSIGILSFDRLQLVEGKNGRAIPISAGATGYAIAVMITIGGGSGILWASIVTLGSWGFFLGLLFVAGGGLMALAGYGLERAIQGLILTCRVLTAFIVAVVFSVFGLLRYIGLWGLAGLAWVVSTLLNLLAAPLDLVISGIRTHQAARSAQVAPQRLLP